MKFGTVICRNCGSVHEWIDARVHLYECSHRFIDPYPILVSAALSTPLPVREPLTTVQQQQRDNEIQFLSNVEIMRNKDLVRVKKSKGKLFFYHWHYDDDDHQVVHTKANSKEQATWNFSVYTGKRVPIEHVRTQKEFLKESKM